MPSRRYFAGQYDKTRFENGKTETDGIINGGEPQPWLTYNGEKIKSTAQFIYSSCGGTDDTVYPGHAPMFISSNRKDGSCYSTSNALVNVSRIYDVPALSVDIPLGHTIAYDNDLVFGFDTYLAFFDFIGFWFMDAPVKVLGAVADTASFPTKLRLKFSGSVAIDQVDKIKVKDAFGTEVYGRWTSAFGGVEWTFVSFDFEFDTEYVLTVDGSLKGKNEKEISSEFSYSFRTQKGKKVKIADSVKLGEAYELPSFISEFDTDNICFEIETGANLIGVYSSGEMIASANVSGGGEYLANIGESMRATCAGEHPDISFKLEREEDRKIWLCENLSDSSKFIKPGARARIEPAFAPDGTRAMKLSGFASVTEHPTEEFYTNPDTAFVCSSIVGDLPLTKSDMGRSFRVSMRIYDTVSRPMRIELSHCTSRTDAIADYRRSCYNLKTKPCEWIDFSFDYTVYEYMYDETRELKKELFVKCFGFGEEDRPIYFSDLKTEEISSGVDIKNVYLVSMDKSNALPEGKSDIVCPKSPWMKK